MDPNKRPWTLNYFKKICCPKENLFCEFFHQIKEVGTLFLRGTSSLNLLQIHSNSNPKVD